MSGDPSEDASAILTALQSAVDVHEADALIALFDESAILIGSGGECRDPDALRRYLTAVATQPESLRWEWQETIPFHQSAGVLGIAAFGEVIVSDGSGERRGPIRLTILAVETADGWRIRQFHGSIPSDF